MNVFKDSLLCFVEWLKIIKKIFFLDIWFKDANGKYLVGIKDPKGSEENGNPNCANNNIIFGRPKKHLERTRLGSYEIYETTLADSSGEFIGTLGFSKDITEEMLLSKFPGFAYRSIDDDHLSMTFLSQGCYDLTGYKPEDLLNKNPAYYDLIHPDYRKKLLKQWENDLNPDEIGSVEYPLTTASGETKWVWEQYIERKDTNQIYIATEGFITDITKRKLAENALTKSEERFRTMFEKAPLGIGIFNTLTGNPTQINEKFAEILKRPKDEILAMSWMQYTHPDDIQPNLRNLDLLEKHGSSEFAMTKRYIRGDGSLIWINMTIAFFPTDDNNHHLCMIEDITDRKQAEEEILFLSYHDTLTGLFNRRYYEQALHRIDNPSSLPISLVLADVNGLKLVNDVFGHLAGDKLLKIVAKAFRDEAREDDIASRIGGDEFILILPRTDLNMANKMVERINSSISSERIECIACSVSFGSAAKTNTYEDINSVFMRAEDRMYRNKLLESTSNRNETVKVITQALYEKSNQEQLHCERVSKLCESMGLALGMSEPEINDLKTAGLLHDIGKIGIDLQLLNKKNMLTKEECAEIKQHSEIGYHILKSVGEFASIAEYVLYHHERIDGEGYPKGIRDEEIPVQSKIISIVNAYDHMTYYYRHNVKKSKPEAASEILKNAGTQFDESLSQIFINRVLNS